MKKELDLVILYLNQVHYYDYYTGFESFCPEDHTRRGNLPLRKSYEKAHENTPPYWLANLTITARTTPSLVQEVEIQTNKELSLYIRKEDESKYRCTECQKLFRGDDFVRKHIKSKHGHLVDHVQNDVEFFNRFCSRGKVEFIKLASNRDGSFGGRLGSRPERDRDYRRDHSAGGKRDGGNWEKKNYNDWDAVKTEKIILNYD